jgi:ABC-2 type transport system permease protein
MDPNGAIPRILGLFPFTSPVGMILSISWTNVSALEVILSLAILAVSVVVVVWLSARIFRLGMLSYGKRLSVRDIVRAFREGRQSIVTASKPRGASL